MTSQPLDAAGIYKVMLPGASSPGLDITLYLNFDHTVRQISDYLNGEAPIVEVGMWQAHADRSGRPGLRHPRHDDPRTKRRRFDPTSG